MGFWSKIYHPQGIELFPIYFLEYILEESHIRGLLQSTGNSSHYRRSSDQGIITKLPLTEDNDDQLRRHQADDPDMHQIIIKPDHLLTIDGFQAICCCG